LEFYFNLFQGMKKEGEEELKEHHKARSEMMIKFFSEKFSPAIHDGAAVKEGFAVRKIFAALYDANGAVAKEGFAVSENLLYTES
jgi:hypothetical protein